MSWSAKLMNAAVACLLIVACLVMPSCSSDSDGQTDVLNEIPVGLDISYQDMNVPVDLVDAECRGDGDCPAETPKCLVNRGICVECLVQADCRGRGFCLEGWVCGSAMCQPNEKTCVANTAKVCNEDGSDLVETNCGDKICYEGDCYECMPNVGDCPSTKVAKRCRADGSGWDEQNCQGDLICANGDCLSCIPGETICDGPSKVKKCAMDGSGFLEDRDCWDEQSGNICHLGQCINLCEFTSKFYTNKGCEYWSVDMEQFEDTDPPYYGKDAPFAVVVSNTYDAFDATVKVFKGNSVVKEVTAPAGLATIINLSPLNLEGPGVTDSAYRVQSNLPIVAYQFNPLENVDVFSNDASLLLPTNVLGRNYRIISMPGGGMNELGQTLTSNFAVVAVEDGDTTIEVTPTANILAGTGLTGINKGVKGTWTLQKGQVANVKTDSLNARADLTGTLVQSDKRIAVFSGHVCSTAPVSTCVGGKCRFDKAISCSSDATCPVVMACDHLEEQIQPLEVWGKEYIIPKTKARGKAPDLVRVVAQEDGTRVTITPPVSGVSTIDAGEFFEFEIDRSVVLTSSKPFYSAIILEGEDAPGSLHDVCVNADDMANPVFCEEDPSITCVCAIDGGDAGYSIGTQSCDVNSDCSPDDANVGDPSLITAVPIEQYRDFYVFLVPTKYKDSYISITAPKGASVALDKEAPMAASEFTQIAGTDYVTAVKHVNPGSHTLTSDKPVGLYVYGWDRYVSYGYPGGMMLIKLKND